MRIVLVVALLMMSGLVAAAPPPPVVGKWKIESIRNKTGLVPKAKLGGMIWDFNADGTLVMTVSTGKEDVTGKAKWTVEGTTLAVDENGQVNKMTLKRKGARLVLTGLVQPPVVMTFVKMK